MRGLTLPGVFLTLILIALVAVSISHPHPHPHPHRAVESAENANVNGERRHRKRADEVGPRRNPPEVLTKRELRKLARRKNAGVDNGEDEATAMPMDPDTMVTRRLPREPDHMHMTKQEVYARHIMLKRRMMLRLFQIQQQVLDKIGWPNWGDNPVVNMSQGEHEMVRDLYAPVIASGKLGDYLLQDNQALYALDGTCKGPRNAHKATWEEEGLDMRVYFPVNSTAKKLRRIEVHAAILRLYMPGDEDTQSWEEAGSGNGTEPTESPELESITTQEAEEVLEAEESDSREENGPARARRNRHREQDHIYEDDEDDLYSLGMDDIDDDEVEEEEPLDPLTSYNITVYQYMRALRKNKKEKLERVASVLVSKNHTGWVRIHIKETAHLWMVSPKKNFGLKVTVEDGEGNKVDVNEVFRTKNCSEEKNETNPNALFALAGAFDLEESNLTVNDQAQYPTLDLITLNDDQDEGDVDLIPPPLPRPHRAQRTARSTRKRAARPESSARRYANSVVFLPNKAVHAAADNVKKNSHESA